MMHTNANIILLCITLFMSLQHHMNWNFLLDSKIIICNNYNTILASVLCTTVLWLWISVQWCVCMCVYSVCVCTHEAIHSIILYVHKHMVANLQHTQYYSYPWLSACCYVDKHIQQIMLYIHMYVNTWSLTCSGCSFTSTIGIHGYPNRHYADTYTQ